MRKFIPALMILAATSAQAVEVKFGDLNYNMSKGEQNFQFDFINQYEKQIDTTMRAYVMDAQYRYAITNDLDAFVAVDYVWNADFDGGRNETISSFQNPTLGASYRVFDQKDFDYNFDVEVLTKQSLFDAKDSNMYEGRSTYEVHGAFGRKWNEANEWQVGLGVVYHADGEAKSNGTKYDQDSSTDLVLRAAYQYRPVNEFMMTLSAEAVQTGEFEYANAKQDAHIDYNFGFAAKYLVDTNLIAKLQITQACLSDFDVDVSGVGSTKVNRRRSNNFGVGIDYLF